MSTSQSNGAGRTGRRPGRALALLISAALSVLLVAACGSNHNSSSASGGGTTASASTAGNSGGEACGNEAKAGATFKAAAAYGVATVAVYKLVIKPARAKAFAKGAPGRGKALLKAAGGVAAAVYAIKKGNGYAKNSKSLCRFVPGLSKATGKLDLIERDLAHGGGNVAADVAAVQKQGKQMADQTGARLPSGF